MGESKLCYVYSVVIGLYVKINLMCLTKINLYSGTY